MRCRYQRLVKRRESAAVTIQTGTYVALLFVTGVDIYVPDQHMLVMHQQ